MRRNRQIDAHHRQASASSSGRRNNKYRSRRSVRSSSGSVLGTARSASASSEVMRCCCCCCRPGIILPPRLRWAVIKVSLLASGSALLARSAIFGVGGGGGRRLRGVNASGNDVQGASAHGLESVVLAHVRGLRAAGIAAGGAHQPAAGAGDYEENGAAPSPKSRPGGLTFLQLERNATRLAVADGARGSSGGPDESKVRREREQEHSALMRRHLQSIADSPLARGVAGLPKELTPALIGAKRGHIECDVDVDDLAYWNDYPQGARDLEFRSPFIAGGKANDDGPTTTKYLTFRPDPGGWNNVRMSLEIMFVIALATGRTLVLPPPMRQSRLQEQRGKGDNQRGFGSFYDLRSANFRRRLSVITMEEFLQKECGENGRFPISAGLGPLCARRGGDKFCDKLYDQLKGVGTVPDYVGKDACFVFDERAFRGEEMEGKDRKRAEAFCGRERTAFYFNSTLQDAPIIHFRASELDRRLMQHFYGAILFTNPTVDNHFKRFVRDYLRYRDEIYCAAGKVVQAIQEEERRRGPLPSNSANNVGGGGGQGGYSALHIRRGDLQYQKVKISAERWYDNTKEIWHPDEILYIATDERNKTWFDPIRRAHHGGTVRLLDDYWDEAGLSNLDPNYMGMIDTIVASRGRAFAGTFFSTFTGYINRMRGYHGLSMWDSYHSFLPRKYEMRTWHDGPLHIFSREWPTGWVGIDGDEVPSQELF